jgi:hypothetical protein
MMQARLSHAAHEDLRHGKKASTAAGRFVGEEMKHKQAHKHGPESKKQAIAIGLSQARKAGIRVPKKQGSKSVSRKRGTTASKRK